MKNTLPTLLATAIAVAVQSPLYADDNDQNNKDSDEKIIVFGIQHLPRADGFSDDELTSAKVTTSDTAAMLTKLPGLDIQQGGGVSGIPVIRGMADDRIRINVDGMELVSACANHMNPPLSYIDPTNVAQATVFAGISPVSVGGDSTGSAIVVESKVPDFSNDSNSALFKGQAGLSWRSNGQELSSKLALNYATENFAVQYNGSYADADNYHAGDDFKPAGPAAAGRRHLDADEVGSSYFQSTNHSLKFAWRTEDSLWQLQYGIQDIPEQGWVNQRMDMTLNDSKQLNISVNQEYDWGSFDGRIYQEKTRHTMQFGEDKLYWYGPNASLDGQPCAELLPGMMGCAAGMPMDTEGENKGLKLHWLVELGGSEVLRFGTEFQRYTLDDWWEPAGRGMWPNTFVNINNGQRDRDAVFLEWENKLSEAWHIQAGVRYENVDMNADEVQGYNGMMANYMQEAMAFNMADRAKSDNNLDISLLARYQLTEDQTLEFGYGRKTRSANLYERYTWSTGGMVMRMINLIGDGNGYVGNLDLDAEVAHTVSLLWQWKGDDWLVSLSPYYSQVDNYIGARRCVSPNMNCGPMNQMATDAFVYLQFVNESAKIYGFDGRISKVLNESDDGGTYTLATGFSYTDGSNRDTGDNLAQIMPLTIDVTLNHSYQSWNHDVEVQLVAERDEVSEVRNEMPTDSYTLLNVRGSYTFTDDLRLDYGIENVLDEYYEHPLSGAYTGQGKTMNGTGISWGQRVPGKGRNFYMGVTYDF